MADNTEVFFESIRDKNTLTAKATDRTLLELAISGVTQAKLLADYNKGFQKGQNRNSIQWVSANNKSGGLNDGTGEAESKKLSVSLKKQEIAIGATSDHFVYTEFGTKYMSAQPVLRPSLAILAGAAPNIIAKEMEDAFSASEAKFKKEKL